MNARLKLLGYFLSEISVLLLAIVAWQGAGDGMLRLGVALGTGLAAIGMAMRWAAYWRKHRHKAHLHEERHEDMHP